MKRISAILNSIVLCGMVMLFLTGCKKEWTAELQGDAPRLFRPAIKGSLQASGNYIDVAWRQTEGAAGYTIEVSVDTFKTVAKSVEVVDTTGGTVDDLLWQQLYQVRVTALHPSDPAKNSRPADFGEVKTPRFPTIVHLPVPSDVGMNRILFKWKNEGEAVTTVKVFRVAAESAQETLVQTIPLTAQNIANGWLLIENLTAATAYRVALYSGEKFRGENSYTTKEPLSGEIIDLSKEDPATVNLGEAIAKANAGATILLKKGATYEISGAVNFSKSITIMSEDNPLVSAKARLSLSGISNFGITANSNMAKLAFVDLELFSNDAGTKYIFNPNTTATIDLLAFENCIIHDVRGVTRYRGGITVGQQTFSNCIIYNIGGYAVLTVDDNKSAVNNFSLENSTVYNADAFLASKNNASGLYKIEHVTFYRAPLSGRNFIDFDGTKNTIAGGLTIAGLIFGDPKSADPNATNKTLGGIRINPSTQITASRNYRTADFTWKEASDLVPLPTLDYTKKSTDLFADPALGNFRIKDNGFAGKDDAGDPRWRP
ncbi:DUF4957 domain-containing protein [Sphingobacterium thalpophilum]|uniref:DUF4957 domain-containing protein n=1 Tax=Sphingobacterium thalpophilum TaxID=259 RepID=A0A4U9UZ64_9SPHI|nr:DUF4957 domain-containing protein [Sphingobacterium thalpophilum]VTR39366.1 Uncharacterised protein [Sphingobacterium thalpophilum]